MADVFLARDELSIALVAVKVLFPEFASDPAFVERFRREAQPAANLNHPNIVGVYDWGQEGGTYFIVMEYIEGRSLADIIRGGPHRAGPRGRDHLRRRGRVVVRAPQRPRASRREAGQRAGHAGRSGQGGRLRHRHRREHERREPHQDRAVMGTATYFSPEQAQGKPVDGRSDLYSLGVVLYEMLAGVSHRSAATTRWPSRISTCEQPGLRGTGVGRRSTARSKRSPSSSWRRTPRTAIPRPTIFAPTCGASTWAPPRRRAEPAAGASGGVGSVRGGGTLLRARLHPLRRAGKRSWGAVVTVAIVFVLLLMLIGVLLVQSDFGKTTMAGPKADVPPVVGQLFSQANATLTGLQFKVVRVRRRRQRPGGRSGAGADARGREPGRQGQHRHAHGQQHHHHDAGPHREDHARSHRRSCRRST